MLLSKWPGLLVHFMNPAFGILRQYMYYTYMLPSAPTLILFVQTSCLPVPVWMAHHVVALVIKSLYHFHFAQTLKEIFCGGFH